MSGRVDSFVRRRLSGAYTVDEWGLDEDLAGLVAPVAGLRWSVDVGGAEHVPAEGPVLLVTNCRLGWSEPSVLALGVRRSTGRWVRLAGVPDIAPVGPALRRLGGVLAHPDEIGSLLRAGECVGLTLGASLRRRHHAGRIDARLVAPALETGATVVPVALVGREVTCHWRMVVGEPIEHPTSRGPLAIAELADRARSGVQSLLDDAFPPTLYRGA